MRQGSLDFLGWIALSAVGYPAPTVGWAFTRKRLRENYRATFGHDLERAGYRCARVRIVQEVRGEGSRG